MVNAYESPRLIEEPSVYGLKDIVFECMIPFYYLYSGYEWDRAIAIKNDIPHHQAFISNLGDYMTLEFFKMSMITSLSAYYYLLQ